MGDWGVGFLGRGEFGEGGREGGFGYGFLCIIEYWLGISLLVCFSLLFFFFLFGRGGLYICISFLAFCPFFPFPFFHFCLFSFPDENHQRLKSGAIPSNHWAGSAKAMIVLRIAATFVVPSRSCSFVENWPFTISRARVWKSL